MNPLLEILLMFGGVVGLIIIAISVFRLHPALALLLAAILLGFLLGFPFTTIIQTIGEGFMNIVVGVGIVIILGAVLGTLMEHSGAMDSIVSYVVQIFGRERPITSLSILGLVIGIPVFCDSGFILLSRVANQMADRRNIRRGITAGALGGGLYAAHTLIPPTPGPVAAAGNLNMTNDLGLVMFAGILVTIPILVILISILNLMNRKNNSPELANQHEIPKGRFILLMPVLIAMAMIATGSVIGTLNGGTSSYTWIFHPITALLVASVWAWLQVPVKAGRSGLLLNGIREALPIVLITGMGGAFGQILKASDLVSSLTASFGQNSGDLGELLLIAFLCAFIIKTAQGSSTAAIVITSSLILPLVDGLSPWQTAILISGIGSGAMAVSHANDSYFWVVTKFGELKVRESYTHFSLVTLAMALTGLATAYILLASS